MFKKFVLLVTGCIGILVIAVIVFINFGPVSNSAVLFNAIFGTGIGTPAQQILQQRLRLPQGFTLSVYAENLPRIRFLEFTDRGDLLVTRPRDGQVLLVPRNKDSTAGTAKVLMDGLRRPHSVALHQQWLYIAESNAIGRVEFDADQGELRGDYRHIITALTDNGNHWSKTIRFGPDGLLYVSMGSTCNVCEEKDPRRATIMRFKADGSDGEIFATGLRNSVGIDWAPWDNSLYATDNGRDLLGDDFPPCELNRIVKGGFYGWPYVNGFGKLDPDLGKGNEVKLKQAISPAHGFRAHNAPLGIRFLTTQGWPERFNNTALVALHGSWNRTEPDGYKVVSLHYQGDGRFLEKDFLAGFENNGDVIGRPVDIAQGPDDCVYISDDYAGAIYRLCYQVSQRDQDSQEGLRNNSVGVGQHSESRDTLYQTNTTRLTANLLRRGETLFEAQRCVECHSLGDNSATAGKKPLVSIAERFSEESLLQFFATPTAPMPPVDLPAEQQQALAAYLLSLP